MKNFSDIKRRIKSVSDTRKITGAMETISVAKMRKALARYESNKAYFETIGRAISDIVFYTKAVGHKVFEPERKGRAAFIVIASDKGLAGGFNHGILKFASETLSHFEQPYIYAVGKIAEEYFDSQGIAFDSEFSDATFEPSAEQAAVMGKRLYERFDNGEISGAYIIFTAMEEHGRMSSKSIKLLPFDRDSVVRERELTSEEEYTVHELIYEPSPQEVLAALIPQYLTGMIYGALTQSSACEYSQHQSAMNSATRNATRILDKLKIEYNRARQESVTGELVEIVTAANGVEHDKR